LGAVVDALVSDADEGLLAALEIKNPASQAKAEVALSALDAAVHVVDGYLMAVRTPDELKAAAENRAAIQDTEKLEAGKSGAEKPGTETQGAVKLRTVARYWNSKDWERVEQAFGARGEELLGAEMRSGF